MERKMKVLIGLLVGVMIINIYSLSKVVQLDALLDQSRSNVASLTHQVQNFHNQLHGIGNAIWQLREEARWLSAVRVDPDINASTPQEIHVVLQWTLREVEQDAHVYAQYRALEQLDWEMVTPRFIGGSSYVANLVLTPTGSHSYQIVVEGSTIKASDIMWVPTRIYRRSQGMVVELGWSHRTEGGITGNISVVCFAGEHPYFAFFNVVDVKVRFYSGNVLMAEIDEPSKPPFDDKEPLAYYAYTTDKSITRIEVETRYADGEVLIEEHQVER